MSSLWGQVPCPAREDRFHVHPAGTRRGGRSVGLGFGSMLCESFRLNRRRGSNFNQMEQADKQTKRKEERKSWGRRHKELQTMMAANFLMHSKALIEVEDFLSLNISLTSLFSEHL